MEIIVTSDSHLRDGILEKIREWNPEAELFLNCGDYEDGADRHPGWLFVRGNNDLEFDVPAERVVEAAGHRIFMCHGHRFPYGRRAEKMAERAKELGCDIVLYGHTHVADIQTLDGILIVNPGSCWMSRDARMPSYARLFMEEGRFPRAEIVEEDQWPEQEDRPRFRLWDWF